MGAGKSNTDWYEVFRITPTPMYVFDVATLRFLAVNDAALEFYGFSRDEFLSLTIADVKPPETVEQLRDVGSHEDWFGAVAHRRRDGSVVEVEIASRPIQFSGHPARIAVARDLSERTRLEEQLRHSQKMEAVGRLAGGIAHDFNNMLNIMLGYTVMRIEDVTESHPMHGPLLEMKRAGERAADLTRQLLTFSRQQPRQVQVVDVNTTLAGMVRLAKRLVGEDVEIETRISPELCEVAVDPGQLEQIVMNIVVNARDAMPNGGKIVLETSQVVLDAFDAARLGDLKPGTYIVLCIGDTGTGMDRETQSHIFEPFFTTKEIGKGTGLGLSIVFGIVQQYRGHVRVRSEVGKGTTFEVYLRSAAEDTLRRKRITSIPVSTRGSETILLVEDENQVRTFIEEVLRRGGYRVLAASHAGEAVLLAEQHAGHIDLLLTDVVMPHTSGRQLADQLLARHPGLRIVFMSGYTAGVALDHGVPSNFAFLQKPIAPRTLYRGLRSVLDGRGGI